MDVDTIWLKSRVCFWLVGLQEGAWWLLGVGRLCPLQQWLRSWNSSWADVVRRWSRRCKPGKTIPKGSMTNSPKASKSPFWPYIVWKYALSKTLPNLLFSFQPLGSSLRHKGRKDSNKENLSHSLGLSNFLNCISNPLGFVKFRALLLPGPFPANFKIRSHFRGNLIRMFLSHLHLAHKHFVL